MNDAKTRLVLPEMTGEFKLRTETIMISYDEPSWFYHANTALGSTDIRQFIRSPRLFRDYREALISDKETDALRFGTVMHTAFLEPDKLMSEIAIKPNDIKFSTNIGKEWRNLHDGLTIITTDEYAALKMMETRMPAEIKRIIDHGKSEVTIRTTLNGLSVQCRTDKWHQPEIIYDLKSIDAIENVDREIEKRGYYIQDEWYRRVAQAETGTRPSFVFIFAEKKFPYRWEIVELDADWQELGRQEVDAALHGIKARMASGCWEDPRPLRRISSPPTWRTSTFDEEG